MNLRRGNNDLVLTEGLEIAEVRTPGKKTGKHAYSGTVSLVLIAVAVALLIASFLFPVLMISGDSMEPGLNDGDLVLLIKTRHVDSGDLICFRWNGKSLLKRVVGRPGDWIMMDRTGRVYVNGALLDEPYVEEFGFGENNDLSYPFQVPEGSYFVIGDNRPVSMDSRNMLVGCVRYDQIIGKVVIKLRHSNRNSAA